MRNFLFCFLSSVISIFSKLLLPNVGIAQVIPDGTTSTDVNKISNQLEIVGGGRAGNNLFHSFQEFSVPNGNNVYFNNAATIENIFNRITGGNISKIEGVIKANGKANLFLINPAGIIFGKNSRLDIGGSFYGSTADSILFPDGEFSATNLDTPPLLTINAPIGLSFRDNPEDIINQSTSKNNVDNVVGLEVTVGKNLTLVGGDISFRTGNASAKGGNIELGGLSKAGIVNFNKDGSLSFPNIPKADINLINASNLDVRGASGGSININSRNLTIEAGDFGPSILKAGITANSNSFAAQAGDIKVNASGIVTLNNSGISNSVENGSVGNSGDINIEARSLNVINAGQIAATTFGKGNTGSVNIVVQEIASFDGRDNMDKSFSGVGVIVGKGAKGNAGDLNITTNSLTLTNRAQLASNTSGEGDAGNININATNNVFLSNSTLLSEVTEETGIGNGGDITIRTSSLLLQDGSALLADTENIGNAGNIIIEASESVVLEGEGLEAEPGGLDIVASQISTTVESNAIGEGGDINIATSLLSVKDNGFIRTNSFGQGNAGNLTASATSIELEGQGFIAAESGFEEGGNIILNVDNRLTLRNNSLISAKATENANGGNITIDTDFIIAFPNQNNDIIASAERGDGGNINITAEALFNIEERPLNDLTNDINVSSEFGLDGAISIFTPDVNTLQRDTEVVSNLLESEQTVAQACQTVRTSNKPSGLIVKGKGGVPPQPIEPFDSETILVDESTINSNLQANYPEIRPIKTSIGDIYPARGVIKTVNGSIILTAYPTNNINNRIPHNSANCTPS